MGAASGGRGEKPRARTLLWTTIAALVAAGLATLIIFWGSGYPIATVPSFILVQVVAMFGGIAFCTISSLLVGRVQSVAGLRAAIWASLWMGTISATTTIGGYAMVSAFPLADLWHLLPWLLAAPCLLLCAGRAWFALEPPLVDPAIGARGVLALTAVATAGAR